MSKRRLTGRFVARRQLAGSLVHRDEQRSEDCRTIPRTRPNRTVSWFPGGRGRLHRTCAAALPLPPHSHSLSLSLSCFPLSRFDYGRSRTLPSESAGCCRLPTPPPFSSTRSPVCARPSKPFSSRARARVCVTLSLFPPSGNSPTICSSAVSSVNRTRFGFDARLLHARLCVTARARIHRPIGFHFAIVCRVASRRVASRPTGNCRPGTESSRKRERAGSVGDR